MYLLCAPLRPLWWENFAGSHATVTFSKYRATSTFQPNSVCICSRNCPEASGSPCTR